MADTWAHRFTMVAGDPAPHQFDLGPPAIKVGAVQEKLGSDITAPYGFVRLAYADEELRTAGAEKQFEALLRGPDEGIWVGPIDIPAIVPIPLPVHVIVRRRTDLGVEDVSARILAQATIGTPTFSAASYLRRAQAEEWIAVPSAARDAVVLATPAANVAVELEVTGAVVIQHQVATGQAIPLRIPAPVRRVRAMVAVSWVFGFGGGLGG